MVKYDSPVPQGHHLHHKKTKADNLPDEDIELLTIEEHANYHNGYSHEEPF